MKNLNRFKSSFFLLLITVNSLALGLNSDSTSAYVNQPESTKKFTLGLYIGVLEANQYTASIYDGYGFDQDGHKNNFTSSFMNQKINNQYGGYGYSGQQDQIAAQLNVTPGTWSFNQNDMPTNMNYAPAFNIGLNTRYSVDENNAILININASKLLIRGNFEIETQPLPNSNQINANFQNFSIIGAEERLIMMFGYQHLLGDKEKNIRPLVEGGLNATLAEFYQNFILINNLNINLTSYYNNVYNTSSPVKRPIGIGFGAFGGIGINIKTNTKYSAQIVYNPSLERINIGDAPALKLQNSLGIRFYYNF